MATSCQQLSDNPFTKNCAYRSYRDKMPEYMDELVRAEDMIGQPEFELQLQQSFPAIYAGLDDAERGLLHLEIAALARATCRAIEREAEAEVEWHFLFVHGLFSKATPDLENAISVSYLEDVFIRPRDLRYDAARSKLPPTLKTALESLEVRWKKTNEWLAKRDRHS